MKKMNTKGLLAMVSLLGVLLFCGCRLISDKLETDNAPFPSHHTQDGYRNLYIEPIDKGVFTFLKMKYFSDTDYADHSEEAYKVPVKTEPDLRLLSSPELLPQITWLGHSTFLIQYQGKTILTDPMLSQRASPVSFAGPERLVPKPVDFNDIPKIDYVVISHNHYDHLDTLSIEMLGNEPLYLVPLGLKEWFLNAGIDSDRIREMDWWDEYSRQEMEVAIVATPSQHWSARGLFDRDKTLWAAWYIQISDFSLWFGGDTGYNTVQFKEIGQKWKDIDLGLIPIGAYSPRWFMKPQHVDPLEAIKIHKDIGANTSIGMHWGTFQLSAEPIMDPAERIESAKQEKIIEENEFITMAIGETYIYSEAVR